MISFIAKFLVALNNNSRPGELASGISFGLLLALIPVGNLLWISIFIFAFFIKHNISALLFSMMLFRLFVPSIDPLLDVIGGTILEYSALQEFFTTLYNIPILSYSNFNNTLVMGGLILGIILWIPNFYIFTILIKIYRKKIASKIADSKLMKFIKKVPIITKISSAVHKLSFLAS